MLYLRPYLVFLVLPILGSFTTRAQDRAIPPHLARDDVPYYQDHRQRDFPFFETTLDLRGIAPADNQTNLSPRALVLDLGEDVHVGFDTELLRVIALWEGDSVTPNSMATLSYAVPLRKLEGGQSQLPRPNGEVRFATGLYPGWQAGPTLRYEDPRPRGPDSRELGRGPLPVTHGRWQAVEDAGDHATLHYTVDQAEVTETFSLQVSQSRKIVTRRITFSSLPHPWSCVVAELDHFTDLPPPSISAQGVGLKVSEGRYVVASLPPSAAERTIMIHYAMDGQPVAGIKAADSAVAARDQPVNRAQLVAHTRMAPGHPQGAYAIDELVIPYPNPWQRRIRPMDLAFRPDGEAIMVSYDGDVFRITGLDTLTTDTVKMRRIASGFHDPQSIVLRGDDIFVFSRLGISRLHDLDDDGDIDRYEMFCNDFVQSAETRAFPLSLVALPDGGFLFTIGGQQELYPALHAGRVLHVSATGQFLRIYADGLRNGYLSKIGSNNRIIATDQQGNWVPATPMHLIEADNFYGFNPGTDRVREVASVPLWVPHRFAQSAIGLIGIEDERHGNMNGSVMMIDYFKPGLLKILGAFDEPLTQAVAIPVPVEIEVPVIKGALNPADGQTYYAGMQIWSSNAPRIEGLSRLRTLHPTDDLPRNARVHAEGVWLKFSAPLDATTMTDPGSYRIMSWDYLRSRRYGSGQYRSDGQPGIDPHSIHSVWLSADRREVFLAVPNLPIVSQLEVRYLRPNGAWQDCLFTVNTLPPFPPERTPAFNMPPFAQLFAEAPAPRSVPDPQPTISVERGLELATQYGCLACHSLDGTTEGKTGPSWQGIYQTRRPLEGGRRRSANSNYLRDSIMKPDKNIVQGYGGDREDVAMPSYEGVLGPDEVDSIIMLIESVGPEP